MTEIKECFDAGEKADICNYILRLLPDWFGIEEAIADYVQQCKTCVVYGAFVDGKTAGFAALKIHNAFTAEIYVMGIKEEYHRKSIGKKLINRCEEYLKENSFEFLTVKTLSDKRDNEAYARTRLFYEAMGLKPLEVFPLLWDESNPCLFMAKYIGNR